MTKHSAHRANNFHWAPSMAVILAAIVVAPQVAAAQPAQSDSATSPEAQGASQGANEEIVVTGERRTGRQFVASSSVAVLSSQDLQDRGVTSLNTLQTQVPGLTVSDAGVANLVNIRGVGRSDVSESAAAGVPIYRDGTPTFNGYFSGAEPYFDIASVEVYKGPQGTFAGGNSTGGAIFVRSADPGFDRLSGFVQGQLGSDNDREFQGALSIPLGDTLALRIATDDRKRGRYYDYSGPFQGHPNELTLSATRLTVLWQPTQQFRLRLKYDQDYIDRGSSDYTSASSGSDLYRIQSNALLADVNRFYRVSANMSYVLDNGVTLSSLTSYQKGHTISFTDTDGTAVATNFLQYRASEDIVSQELNLVSPSTDRFRYTLGLFYSRDDLQIPYFASGSSMLAYTALVQKERPQTDYAAFGSFTYDLTPSLHLDVGARYNAHSLRQDIVIGVGSNGVLVLPLVISPSSVPDDRSVTGKVSLSYDIDSDRFIYGYVATGHKPNGLNGTPTNPSFDSEDLTNFEAGYRQRFAGGRVTFQADAYYYQYDNYQFTSTDPVTNTGKFGNVPGTTNSWGVEAQLNGNFADTQFNFSAAWADSELPNFSAKEAPASPLINLTGRGLPYLPTWTVSAGAEHSFETALGRLTPRLDVSYISNQWATFWRDPGQELDAHVLTNAQLRWDHGDWTATAFITNASNEKYVAAYFSGVHAPGVPRQAGIRISRNF